MRMMWRRIRLLWLMILSYLIGNGDGVDEVLILSGGEEEKEDGRHHHS